MGFLKKLYGESLKVRHSGSLSKEAGQLRHGIPKRFRQAKRRASEFGYDVRMKFGR